MNIYGFIDSTKSPLGPIRKKLTHCFLRKKNTHYVYMENSHK